MEILLTLLGIVVCVVYVCYKVATTEYPDIEDIENK